MEKQPLRQRVVPKAPTASPTSLFASVLFSFMFRNHQGCMDGRTDGRTDGWMDGWMDGCMDGWMDGLDEWMDGLMMVPCTLWAISWKFSRQPCSVYPSVHHNSTSACHKDGNVAQELHQNDAVLVLRYLFERRPANFDFFSKLRTAVYPSNMAPIGAKLWQNAFQTICNFAFFDPENFFWGKCFGGKNRGRFFFEKVRFWRSYAFLSVLGTSVVKSYCPNCLYFWGDFLGEGVNDSICVEILDLAPKVTSTIWTFFSQNFWGSNFVFKKVRFWRSHEFPSVIGTSVVKSYCPNCLYFWGDFLGEGVNDSICVENLDLAPKMTSTIWCYDVMIIWY